ncbi:imidazole glycerol phosphate synthase subunit HisH [Limnoglobus roseus]|uniref:Imidazole glycerol phosphate synthase subunit HisH n=1 Tax=Limnoglobus roseus TaxID=2598579 RepID=A0A5C1AFC9_9BACT|nr:imidazole glycerol phosphate synthase subunit HisH [Limnoglobus roseus]QEL15844.1 imidazole glycerol phosphate synthase subunit HisH [Limnoglobus roseus]
MTRNLVIVDYGMANLRSVQKAFESFGHAAEITSDANRIAEAGKVVLPGVGAFRDAIARLRETGLADAIVAHAKAGRPFLGICLGMQLLFTRSHEDGVHAGLDLFPGDVVSFPTVPGLKVPHMGWNNLALTRPDCPLFRDLPPHPSVYFVHGYYPQPADANLTAATADYPDPFTAVVWRDNVMATQFHPEKSQAIGLKMLKNFAEL